MFAGHPDQYFGYVSYAQHGDDMMILNMFRLCGFDRLLTGSIKPTWLDLGAHHPQIISNTCKLYEMGARGVNVEANPSLIDAFKIERPEDVNVCSGVGVINGAATFYMYSDSSGRNTFSKDEVHSLHGAMRVMREVRLPVNKLAHIIDRHCGGKFPPLLLSDIEGLDYDVLSSADFDKYGRPLFIVVETRRDESLRMREMLNAKGFFCYCR